MNTIFMFSGGRCQFGAPGGVRRPYSAKLAHLEQPIRALSASRLLDPVVKRLALVDDMNSK
jgi:hypothetical protein